MGDDHIGKPISPAWLRKIQKYTPTPYYVARDIWACHEVAVLYAMFLDNRGQLELFSPGGDREDQTDVGPFGGA